MNLIKLSIPLLASIFYSIVCYSQSDSTQTDYKHSIQFYVIDEIIAAYKYNIAENSAFRFVINATGLYNDNDSDEIEYREQISDSVTYFENYQNIHSNQFFEFKIHYLYSINLHAIVKIYFGGGPFVNYQFSSDENYREWNYSNSEEVHKAFWQWNEKTWSVGISALIGIECVVYENISLFTEYEGYISRGWQNRENYFSNSSYKSEEFEIDIWTYELNGLRIGLSIYF